MAFRPLPLILVIPIALAMGSGLAQADGPVCGPINAVTGQPVTDAPAVVFTEGLDAALTQTCRELAEAADDVDPPACRITESGAVDAAGATGTAQTHYALYCVGPEAATGTCDTQGLSATMRISRKAPANSVDRRPRPP